MTTLTRAATVLLLVLFLLAPVVGKFVLSRHTARREAAPTKTADVAQCTCGYTCRCAGGREECSPKVCLTATARASRPDPRPHQPQPRRGGPTASPDANPPGR